MITWVGRGKEKENVLDKIWIHCPLIAHSVAEFQAQLLQAKSYATVLSVLGGRQSCQRCDTDPSGSLLPRKKSVTWKYSRVQNSIQLFQKLFATLSHNTEAHTKEKECLE